MSRSSAEALAEGARPELEVELLLGCARTRIDAESAARIRALLREDLDWAYLIRTALWHGTMPLLYRSLKNTAPEAVPKAILDQLRDYFRSNTLRNFSLTAELLKLLRSLEDHGISAVPYKGPALASSVYGDCVLRQFSDLDILVRRQDVLRAKDLLISLGYRPQYRLTAAQEVAYLRSECEYNFHHENKRIAVELHWRILPRHFSFPLEFDRLRERLEPVSLLGATVLGFAPEDLLLILCAHGTKHCWGRLGWICDVAELVRGHPGMDWEWVMEHARSLGSERMLFLGLFLAHNLLGATLPGTILQRMPADSAVTSLAAQVHDRLFKDTQSPPDLFATSLFHLKARERMADRLRYCFRLATTPRVGDWMFLSLPAYLSFLYYPLRAIRLFGKYGSRGLKHLPAFLTIFWRK